MREGQTTGEEQPGDQHHLTNAPALIALALMGAPSTQAAPVQGQMCPSGLKQVCEHKASLIRALMSFRHTDFFVYYDLELTGPQAHGHFQS